MAEFLNIDEIRNYDVNGTKFDLVKLVEARDLGMGEGFIQPESVSELHVGQIVYAWVLGAKFRRGVVTKVGRTKVTVALTTQGAIDEALRYRGGQNIRVANQSVQLSQVRYEAPAAPVAEVEEPAQVEVLAEALAEALVEDAERQAAKVAAREAERQRVQAEHEALAAAENEGLAVPAVESDVEAVAPVSPAPVPGAAGSAVVAILERVWHLIREENDELPDVVIVTGSAFVGPPRWAHHRASGWTARIWEAQPEKGAALLTDGPIAEMFVAGETLAKGAAFTLETMLHEAGHALAGVRGIKDTSRQGRWHNSQFKALTEELGLEWTKGNADPQIGFSDMLITDATKERYAALLDELEAAIHLTITAPGWTLGTGEDGTGPAGGERIPGGRHGGKAKGGQGAAPSSNNLKATCGCAEPRIIRASRKVLAEGEIMCGKCREPFTLAE